jgi:MFS family permease
MLESRRTSSASDAPVADRLPPELRRLAVAIMLGAFMVALDMTMVNVALHTLARDFSASVTTIQWVATGYLLALAMTIPLTGWAIERFGARPSWVLSLAVFIAGSVLCGLAWSPGSLIAFRVLQGVGGGMLMPLAQTILAQAAGPQRIGRVMAAVGVPAMLGPVLGPVVGGLAAVVYGLAQSGTYGSLTNWHVIAPVAAGVALLLLFARHALSSADPIVDVRLFAARSFSAPAALVFLFSMAMLGVSLLLPLYFQQARHQSALAAGLLLAPSGLGMGLAMIVAGRLTDRLGARPFVLTGLLLSAVSTLAYTQIDPHTSFVLLAGLLVLNGAGIGSALVPSLAAPYASLRRAQIPRATSAIRILQQLGGSFGVALLAVVLQRQLAGAGDSASAIAHAYGQAFWWALGFIALAAVPALLLPRHTANHRANESEPTLEPLVP